MHFPHKRVTSTACGGGGGGRKLKCEGWLEFGKSTFYLKWWGNLAEIQVGNVLSC